MIIKDVWMWIFPKLLSDKSGEKMKDWYKDSEKILLKFFVKTNGSTLKQRASKSLGIHDELIVKYKTLKFCLPEK